MRVLSARIDSAGAELRAAAARLNTEVVSSGHSLAAIDYTAYPVSERDQSLLRAMLAGSLRWHHRFEWQLQQLLDRPLKRRDAELGALLRIGLTQIEALRVPDHAAVSATVAATAALGLGHARGLVNAVLRRYLRDRDALNQRCASVEVCRFSYPQWLIASVKGDWPDAFTTILDAGNEMPALWLRVNRTRIGRSEYLALLAEEGIEATTHEACEDAVLLTEARPVDEIPGFAAGLVSVQDAAAQYAVGVLSLTPGQRVLDACAAPGGKAAHCLERCPGLGELVAIDNDAARMDRVRQNLDRLGLTATLLDADATAPDGWFDGRLFDRILLDAPCTATGVIRRNPDIKLLRREADVGQLSQQQGAMLDALWPLLAPGGRLVYVTCSVLKAEGIVPVTAFAARTPDAELAEFGSAQHRQFLPGETNTDGFYYACLTKGGSLV